MQIYFAPIQGFTDYVYRNAHAAVYGGIDKYFTPFIRVEDEGLRKKDINDLFNANVPERSNYELVPQIIANNACDFAKLVDFVIDCGYSACDINFGCPFPQQSKKFRGCGILQNPDMVADVLRATRKYQDMRFSLKMRLGYESAEESLAVAGIINSVPLRFVTIHPRLGRQMYKGDVDMEGFRKLASAINHPIVYNGDINSIDQAKDLMKMFPNLSALMIGRGLIANPELAECIHSGKFTFSKTRFLKFINLLVEGYTGQYGSELMVLDKMKTFFTYSNFNAKAIKAIQKSRSLSEFVAKAAIAF